MNIAFAGFRHGHIFVLYDKALNEENVHIVGCYEEDLVEREVIEKNKGIKFSYDSYEALLKDEQVEAVAIGDYYAKRGKMIIEALKYGKHVICDKPICTNLVELEEIERLSTEKRLQVCCMLDLRYMAQVDQVKKMIDNGELGKIHIASFTGQHCLDYGNRPKWYFEKGKHGGTINDIAIHGMDLIRYLTGKNLTKVNCAKVWNAFAAKEPDFKDCAQFMVEMDGMSLLADVSYAAPKCSIPLHTYWNFYLWGTKGMINFKYADNRIYVYKDKEVIMECDQGELNYLKDFMREINGERTRMNSKDILESQRQTLTIQKIADESMKQSYDTEAVCDR